MKELLTTEQVKGMTHTERMHALGVTVQQRSKAQDDIAKGMRLGNIAQVTDALGVNSLAIKNAARLRY